MTFDFNPTHLRTADPAAWFRTQTALFIVATGVLSRQMYHAAWVAAWARGAIEVGFQDVAAALSLECLVLTFLLNTPVWPNLSRWSHAFAVGGFLINLLYYFPTVAVLENTDPLAGAAKVIYSALLPIGVSVISHIILALSNIKAETSNLKQALSTAEAKVSELEQALNTEKGNVALAQIETAQEWNEKLKPLQEEATELYEAHTELLAAHQQMQLEHAALQTESTEALDMVKELTDRLRKQGTELAEKREQLAAFERYTCDTCKQPFPNVKALNGHKKGCKPANADLLLN